MHKRTRRLSLALVALGAIVTATAPATSALASPTGPAKPAQLTAAQGLAIRQELAQLTQAGASDAEIQQKLGLVRINPPRAAGVKPLTVPANVTVSTPAIYYDSVAKDYFVESGWSWNVSSPDVTSHTSANVGGYDGYGVRFSRNIDNLGGSLYICPSEVSVGGDIYSCYYATNYWTNSAAGASWKFQDKGYYGIPGSGYNSATGSAVFEFKPLATSCTQAFGAYVHTWSSSQITGFGLSVDGFDIAWTNASSGWQRTSGAGSLYC